MHPVRDPGCVANQKKSATQTKQYCYPDEHKYLVVDPMTFFSPVARRPSRLPSIITVDLSSLVAGLLVVAAVVTLLSGLSYEG